MSYLRSKADWKKKAEQHEERMHELYKSYIDETTMLATCYGLNAKTPAQPSGKAEEPEVIFTNEGTVSALFQYRFGKTAVLDFASYLNPGGGYMTGSSAQEEMLCHASTLYAVLNGFPAYFKTTSGNSRRFNLRDESVHAAPSLFL